MVGRRFGSVGGDALRASPDGSVIPGASGNVAAVGVGGCVARRDMAAVGRGVEERMMGSEP
jgi:hypothetical protein